MVDADSIPRYKEPVFDDEGETPGGVMHSCCHAAACLRLIELLCDEQLDTTLYSTWEYAGAFASCPDCLEWQ